MATVPPNVAMTTVQQPITPPGLDVKHWRTVRGLAIAEIVLGSLCIICGVILVGIYKEVIAEGIWCGLWVVVAGGLGVPAGGPNSSRCLVNCHIAFSIIATVFTGPMFYFGITGAIYLTQFDATLGAIYSIMTILSLLALIVLIVSASFCCCTSNGCCQYNASPGGQTQVMYVTTTQPSAQMVPPNTQQGYQPMSQTKQQEFQAIAAQPPAYQT